jgi:hypothetical protein
MQVEFELATHSKLNFVGGICLACVWFEILCELLPVKR